MARHPSFTADRASTVVMGLTWAGLRQAWTDSTSALRVAGPPEIALGLVTLRAALLDEMQRSHPHAFAAWYAREWAGGCPDGRRRRRPRSTPD